MSNQPETHEHEPRAVPRVVPADRLQPPPDRPGRHGDVRAAVPRSVQLHLRSAGRRSASTWSARRCTRASPPRASRASTMRRGANYSTWWNGGLRTTAYFHNMIGLLTETIGNPTPMEIPFVPRAPAAERRPAVPDRAADVALPPVDRLLAHGQPRGARLRVALPRDVPLQHLPDGHERDRARQQRHLDDVRRGGSTSEGGDREGRRRRRRRR